VDELIKKIMNNPILLTLIIYQLIVAMYYFIRGGFLLGSLFIVYALANLIMLFMKVQ